MKIRRINTLPIPKTQKRRAFKTLQTCKTPLCSNASTKISIPLKRCNALVNIKLSNSGTKICPVNKLNFLPKMDQHLIETKLYIGTNSEDNNYIHLSTPWVSKHQILTKQTKTNNRTYLDKTNIKMNGFNNSPTDI